MNATILQHKTEDRCTYSAVTILLWPLMKLNCYRDPIQHAAWSRTCWHVFEIISRV